jgi:hypothetical protein
MVITSRMHITRGMDITGLSVVPGGRGVVWSMVTTRMSGQADIITIGRIAMATDKLSLALKPRAKMRPT